jgi:hypothetical protein
LTPRGRLSASPQIAPVEVDPRATALGRDARSRLDGGWAIPAVAVLFGQRPHDGVGRGSDTSASRWPTSSSRAAGSGAARGSDVIVPANNARGPPVLAVVGGWVDTRQGLVAVGRCPHQVL